MGVQVDRRPYLAVVSVIDQQRVFPFATVQGTFVGYRLLTFLKGANIPSYHFHLLTANKRHGNHVLEYRLLKGTIEVDRLASDETPEPSAFSFVLTGRFLRFVFRAPDVLRYSVPAYRLLDLFA